MRESKTVRICAGLCLVGFAPKPVPNGAGVKTWFVSWNVALPFPGSSLPASVEVRHAGR